MCFQVDDLAWQGFPHRSHGLPLLTDLKNRCPYICAKAEDHKVINVAIGEKYQVINQRDI